MKRINNDISGSEKMSEAIKKKGSEAYLLTLYVTGTTPRSTRAIANIKKICEEHLKGRYSLKVIDLYQEPSLAKSEQILAAPTLVKKLPMPVRRIIGDMSSIERVLVSLDIKEISQQEE